MRIGQVVREYQIPVNSLYFYINNGLLVPPRRNNQYVFDERTLADLAWIQELKQMRFPLKTIHRLLSLRRISNFCAEVDCEERRQIFLAQEQELLRQEEELSQARRRLHGHMRELEQPALSGPKTGVPVELLHLLCCPDCGGELLLDGVTMSQQYVFRASLSCSCGYCAKIADGILQTQNTNQSQHDKPDTTRECYRDLPSRTLSLFEQSYRCLEDMMGRNAAPGKVWLESYPTAWFFFHNHLELLTEQDSLIVIDKFPETLAAYKAVIENQGAPCHILYLADAGVRPPIRRGVIDCCMDFFASNEYNFYHPELYLEQMRPYFKENAALFGVYFFFQNGPRSLQTYLDNYPEASSSNFNIQWFLDEMSKSFHILETTDCGFSLDSGKNLGLGFHVPGEELHLQPYYGRLKRRPDAAGERAAR